MSPCQVHPTTPWFRLFGKPMFPTDDPALGSAPVGHRRVQTTVSSVSPNNSSLENLIETAKTVKENRLKEMTHRDNESDRYRDKDKDKDRDREARCGGGQELYYQWEEPWRYSGHRVVMSQHAYNTPIEGYRDFNVNNGRPMRQSEMLHGSYPNRSSVDCFRTPTEEYLRRLKR